jgi:GTP-binding protein
MDAHFLRACSSEAEFPPPELPEVAVAGRSNCGKSSLINAVTGRTALARASSTPGRTQQIVFFQVSLPDAPAFLLVDLPGYGYARASREAQRRWIALAESYVGQRPCLALLLVLLDIRREAGESEQGLLRWTTDRGVSPLVVLTKADKLGKSQRLTAAEHARRTLGLERRPLTVSTRDPDSVVLLRQQLVSRLPR